MGTASPIGPPTLAREFCHQCNWAFACWIAHRRIFDDNPNKEILDRNAPNFNEHLWRISQTYSYLQICKLHDPACSRGTKSSNLSISYIIANLDWGDEMDSIRQLAEKLNQLYSRINPARNKIIAHNDLGVLLQGEPVGEFPEGLDKEYFQCLQQFASRVHKKCDSGHYLFKDMNHVMDGAYEYLEVLRNSDQATHGFSPPA
ncbi:MAG: hypothetical protein ACRD3N_16285 [Terracidiphilus sp.]